MSVRLTELAPRWVGEGGRRRLGVSFDCPKCRDRRIAVLFSNPIDGGEPASLSASLLWHRSGGSFETLTLTPSIDASKSGPCGVDAGHWHGHLKNGEVV